MKPEYTEEELREAFYKGREQKRLPDETMFFIRPTFEGYLRELRGLEDPIHNYWKRFKEFKDGSS